MPLIRGLEVGTELDSCDAGMRCVGGDADNPNNKLFAENDEANTFIELDLLIISCSGDELRLCPMLTLDPREFRRVSDGGLTAAECGVSASPNVASLLHGPFDEVREPNVPMGKFDDLRFNIGVGSASNWLHAASFDGK